MAVATLRVRRGEFGEFRRTAAYRHAISREFPPERTNFFYATSSRDVVMAKDGGKISNATLARTDEISERAIFWGMIFTVLVVIAGMTRGMFG
jgi:hypothetical protein